MSTLFDAIGAGDEDAVVRALRGGADPEADDDGETALYRAAVADEPGIVRLLLAAGADPGRASGPDGGDLPLCGAACGGHAGTVRALLAAGARPDQEEEFGFTALAWAVRLGHAETVRALLDHGADPDRPGPDGLTPLTAAARRGSTACVRALLDHGARGAAPALREARRWIGVDVAAELRRGLVAGNGGGETYEAVVRRVREDGGVTVVVELLREDGRPGSGDERQTGHAAVATLLEAALGRHTPSEELAARALRCGDPELDDWTTAVAELAGRADEETFVAAAAWCAYRDPLRQAFGARVLGALPGFAASAVPVLRRLAAEAAGTAREPVLSVVTALGACGEQAAVPELLAAAGHPDPEVRRAVAGALAGLVPAGHMEALGVLLGLSRDGDARVRDWAVLALAELPDDTPLVREALAERLADPDPETAAEAARGLAIRQDPRAVDALAAVLADGDPDGAPRETALAALEFVRDARVRTRLEWIPPRGR
ncbi:MULTISPECIES: ankyrin repeat domain-containing protein [unclassified Streptomyces]|uniref:ankyrin repeat domain-containing protein n=1 Tax=unclassified Streptomyces TaxID=2593676 RepID=UPI003701EA91